MTLTVPDRHSPAPTYGSVWKVAWPIIIANSATPLLGLVDTVIIGHLGAAAPLAAIAVGTLIFNFLYMGFGFLRMGTTGFTAQALGAGDEAEVRASVMRAGLLGGGIGLALIALQWPIAALAFPLLDAGPQVEPLARAYFFIRIWGAPAVLIHFALIGWFIGLQKTRWSLALQIWLNSVNILLDVLFVVGLEWGVAGVATGTLIAEISTVFLGLILVRRHTRRRKAPRRPLDPAFLLAPAALRRILSVNGDIFIRTLCLIFAIAWFTAQGAREGETILAANYILLQFIVFSAFFLDGFAFAAEALVGSAIGAGERNHLTRAVTLSTHWAAATAALLTLGLAVFGAAIIDVLTTAEAVRAEARRFLPWAVAVPIVSVWCFQFDGIFIGATRTADMRNMMALSLAFYIAAWFVLAPVFGNHGLWAAFTLFFAVRGITLALRYPRLVNDAFPA